MVLRELTAAHPNFADYTVKIKSSEERLVEEVKALAEQAKGALDGDAGSLPNAFFDRHLYQPLLKDRGEEIKVSPSGLEESEERFVAALRDYCAGNNGALPPKLFLLRNLTRSKGVGFFDSSGFYPDFILWVKYADGSQKVVFVEPHGMRNDDPPPNNSKVDLYLALGHLSDRIEERDGPRGAFHDSYIVSATPYHELSKKWGEGWTRERFAKKHVLFEDDLDARIPVLLQPRDELERRISTSYPPPLARGYRSLMRAGDPRDLYREQLRFAENILAFLASVSLALLKNEDRTKAGIDLKRLWSGGISPGDWREIIQRCSKVFAGYRNVPLAENIQRLKISTEQKGFGLDVYELIKAKNDYKHDRGPTDLEDIANASDEAQVRLRRCMEALTFFTDFQVHQVEGIDRGGDTFSVECLRFVGDRPDLPLEEIVLRERPREKGLFLDLGAGNWLSLYPFILSKASSDGEVRETYFVDAWNTKKGVARMKGFDSGGTIFDEEVAETLAKWPEGS